MASFRGTFDFSLAAKNRLPVPATFRAALGEGAVLSKATAPCVQLWRPPDFEAFVKAAKGDLNPASGRARAMSRFFSANSHDTALDGAGRVGFPPFLLEHASLQKDVVVTGADICLEVWDRGVWADYNDRLAAEITAITDGLDHAG